MEARTHEIENKLTVIAEDAVQNIVERIFANNTDFLQKTLIPNLEDTPVTLRFVSLVECFQIIRNDEVIWSGSRHHVAAKFCEFLDQSIFDSLDEWTKETNDICNAEYGKMRERCRRVLDATYCCILKELFTKDDYETLVTELIQHHIHCPIAIACMQQINHALQIQMLQPFQTFHAIDMTNAFAHYGVFAQIENFLLSCLSDFSMHFEGVLHGKLRDTLCHAYYDYRGVQHEIDAVQKYLNFDMQRFVEAQEQDYEIAITEIKEGRKKSHWMWYIFPQIAGLGSSDYAQHFAIPNLEAARAYMKHPYLRHNLIKITQALLSLEESNPSLVMGCPDDLKLRSCMTLFELTAPDVPEFGLVLEKFYGGNRDSRTFALIEMR